MVMISKEDQEKVTKFIERMERELQELHAFLGNIARRSNDKGFLKVGDTVKVVKKAETPNKSQVVERAKVISLDYPRIFNLKRYKRELVMKILF